MTPKPQNIYNTTDFYIIALYLANFELAEVLPLESKGASPPLSPTDITIFGPKDRLKTLISFPPTKQ